MAIDVIPTGFVLIPIDPDPAHAGFNAIEMKNV
jgi:hypothetical protein